MKRVGDLLGVDEGQGEGPAHRTLGPPRRVSTPIQASSWQYVVASRPVIDVCVMKLGGGDW